MKLLLLPENNSLSHIAKSLALKEVLEAKGHEVILTSSKARSDFLNKLGYEHHILPDIQEADNASLPTINWFKRPQRIAECIKAEVDLLEKEKPDRVLGVFRFTGKASAHIAGVPYDSLICGCMIPDSGQVLGYSEDETDYKQQKEFLSFFYRYAAEKMNKAFREMGVNPIDDMRDILKGERTFLWDFPEFMLLPSKPDLIHIGPFFWYNWSHDHEAVENNIDEKNPLAVVSFGTGNVSVQIVERIIAILLNMGYFVLLAAGGQNELLTIMPDEPRLIRYLFAPLHKILPFASLIITHGGQMTIFESLLNRVPVIVMPCQPEQLHNGLCLERIDCGCRLVIPEPFRGNTDIYMDALSETPDHEIERKINNIVENPLTSVRLEEMSEIIKKYNGAEMLAKMIEE